jgi:uncharacterized membrane protein YqjE
MSPSQKPSTGLLASVRTLLGTLLGIVQTRLELLVTEIEEERLRLTKMLVFGLMTLFFLGMTVLLLTTFLVAAFWDSHRLMAIAAVAVIYFGMALLCGFCLRQQARQKPRLFSASLAEFSKDRAELAGRE